MVSIIISFYPSKDDAKYGTKILIHLSFHMHKNC